MTNNSLKNYLCYTLTILIVLYILKLLFKKSEKQQKEEFESNYLPNYKVNINCKNNDGIMVPGEDNIDTHTSESRKSCRGAEILDEKEMCVVDKMDDDLFKFATKQPCDCNKNAGNTVCDMKHSNDTKIVKKICQKRERNHSCLVDRMENDNHDYIKGLMLGTNVY